MLSRHGARDPTAAKTVEYGRLISRIKANVKNFTGDYAFLANYTYTLGADQLTFFGQQEMVASGMKFYERYQTLTKNSTPFFRSSGEARVVESAQNFTQGFYRAKTSSTSTASTDPKPYPILIIPESPNTNNTLSHSLCTAFETSPNYTIIGPAATKAFLSTSAPPITSRLNAGLPGANLSNTDTLNLMDLCPFNTVASTSSPSSNPNTPPTPGLSPFCRLFTTPEWSSYNYLQTLSKFYSFGPGNPLGPTQGVGFVNELVARLTDTPVMDHTSTNSTLDGNDSTFPLGMKVYADFSHDSDMTAIFSAMGLYNGTGTGNGMGLLSTSAMETVDETGGYSASWTVQFAARAYFEKMVCGDETAEEMVRVIVNDRVLPLRSFGADARGMVPLGVFVDKLGFARGGGDWEDCFV